MSKVVYVPHFLEMLYERLKRRKGGWYMSIPSLIVEMDVTEEELKEAIKELRERKKEATLEHTIEKLKEEIKRIFEQIKLLDVFSSNDCALRRIDDLEEELIEKHRKLQQLYKEQARQKNKKRKTNEQN